mgnify:CR=1 FL=1
MMKHLKRFNLFEFQKRVMYHVTHKKNLDSILKNGLMIDQPLYMTEGGKWSHEVYGCNPIFLSQQPESTAKQKLLALLDVAEVVLEHDATIDGVYIDDAEEAFAEVRSALQLATQKVDYYVD